MRLCLEYRHTRRPDVAKRLLAANHDRIKKAAGITASNVDHEDLMQEGRCILLDTIASGMGSDFVSLMKEVDRALRVGLRDRRLEANRLYYEYSLNAEEGTGARLRRVLATPIAESTDLVALDERHGSLSWYGGTPEDLLIAAETVLQST